MSANGTRPCTCMMFKTNGICYHTGYSPTFRDQQQPPVVPEAVKRMHAWLALPEVQHAEQRRAREA